MCFSWLLADPHLFVLCPHLCHSTNSFQITVCLYKRLEDSRASLFTACMFSQSCFSEQVSLSSRAQSPSWLAAPIEIWSLLLGPNTPHYHISEECASLKWQSGHGDRNNGEWRYDLEAKTGRGGEDELLGILWGEHEVCKSWLLESFLTSQGQHVWVWLVLCSPDSTVK